MAAFQAVVYRRDTTPFDLLAVVASVLAAQICLMTYTHDLSRSKDISTLFELAMALSIVMLILQMPMRAPQLPKDEIGSQSEPPSYELRSPEDDLTLWQFMTVSWMSPLISLGFKRQLNEDDVWALGFEFQHRYLHDAFRELRGSVTGRLLKANGIDLVIMSFLAVTESLASTRQRKRQFSFCGG